MTNPYPLDRFDEHRAELESLLAARTPVLVVASMDDARRIDAYLEFSARPPRTILARIRALLRVRQMARGHAADFYLLFRFARRHRMIPLKQGSTGYLFEPAEGRARASS